MAKIEVLNKPANAVAHFPTLLTSQATVADLPRFVLVRHQVFVYAKLFMPLA